MFSRTQTHLSAEAKHRKIEFISTLENQAAVGERKNVFFVFRLCLCNVNTVSSQNVFLNSFPRVVLLHCGSCQCYSFGGSDNAFGRIIHQSRESKNRNNNDLEHVCRISNLSSGKTYCNIPSYFITKCTQLIIVAR